MPSLSRLQAVVLDWAGTTVDFGSCAPAQVFVAIFQQRGVKITDAESREPMGRAKREHIAAIAAMPRVAEQWAKQHGALPDDRDVQLMYDEFLPLQKEALRNGSDVIPGIAAAIEDCRRRGLKIGSSTGYTRELMSVVAPLAEQGGYRPDAIVCSDDVPAGRPAPWMNFRAAELLGTYPMSGVLVVDDTAVGIQAGAHAGCPTVAIVETGNAMGLTLEQLDALEADERQRRRVDIESMFRDAGADYVLPSVAGLPDLLDSHPH